jgi:hypothetical protein
VAPARGISAPTLPHVTHFVSLGCRHRAPPDRKRHRVNPHDQTEEYGKVSGMKISGPDRYELAVTSTSYSVTCARGTSKFSGIATSRKPKLYVVSTEDQPIYVGVTKQPIRNRFRLGWNAKGETGYYGYAWRHHHPRVVLDVWCHDDPPPSNDCLDIETIEAEVVFLIRTAGQWPKHQTEIHFHQSNEEHRAAAASIMKRYGP